MLYKDYFIPDNSQYLFFKLLFFFYKTHYPLALGPSTVPHVPRFLIHLLPPQASLPASLSRPFVL